jgi:hypothetical protein
MGEDHEVVFVVADDTPSARKAAQDEWGGGGRSHGDAVTRLDMVDGYTVTLHHTGLGGDGADGGLQLIAPATARPNQTAGDNPPF